MNASLEALKALLASGEFHHATYRNFGTLWEGLYFYRRDVNAARGFELAGAVNARMDADAMVEAESLVRATGVSVGAYGQG